MGVMVIWVGLPVLGRCLVDSDGIDVILGGLYSAVGCEAGRRSVEEMAAEKRSAEWVSVVVRSAESSADRGVRSAGPGSACSTTGKLVRATAAVVEDLGQCSRAG